MNRGPHAASACRKRFNILRVERDLHTIAAFVDVVLILLGPDTRTHFSSYTKTFVVRVRVLEKGDKSRQFYF